MKQIAIIGAGTMGLGIAHIMAQYDLEVSLVDLSEEIFVTDLVEINYKDIDYIDIQPHRSKFLSKCFEDFEKEDSINKALEMILPTYKFISNFYCEFFHYQNLHKFYILNEQNILFLLLSNT